MPIYQMKAPDGRTYRIEGPPGASDDEVRDAIISQNPQLAEPEEQSWTTAFQRGAARAPEQLRETYEGLKALPSALSNVLSQAYQPQNIKRGLGLLTKPETYERIGEETANIVRTPIKRYGTTARAKETIATDPLGALMDVSLAGSAAGYALKQVPKAAKLGAALERKFQAVDPLTMASRVVTKVPREVAAFRFDAPDTSEIRAMKDAAYKESEAAGALFNPQALQQFSADAKTVQFNAKNNPKIANLIEDIDDTIKTPQSLKQIDELRQRIKYVEESIEPSDRKLAGKLREKLDDFVDDSLQDPANFITGQPGIAIPALQKARKLNSQMRKAEDLERLLTIADIKAPMYSASGLENAIRAQVREFVKDPKAKKLRGYSKQEIQALRDVAEGGSVTNVMRFFGRFAPTGPVSAMPSGFAGSIDPVTGAMIAGGGVTGRIGATGGTKYAVQQAGQLIRGGTTAPQKIAEFLRNDKRVKAFLAKNPSMAMSIDMMKRAAATGSRIDPYYARQLAVQLARSGQEEEQQ